MRTTTASRWGVPAGSWGIRRGSARVGLSTHVLGTTVDVVFDDVTGMVDIRGDPVESSISLWIKAASLASGHRRRDHQLRSQLGLDVRRFPVIAFNGSALALADANTVLVEGVLEMRGRRVPLTLPASIDTVDDCRTDISAHARVTVESLGLRLPGPFGMPLPTKGLCLDLTASVGLDHCVPAVQALTLARAVGGRPASGATAPPA